MDAIIPRQHPPWPWVPPTSVGRVMLIACLVLAVVVLSCLMQVVVPEVLVWLVDHRFGVAGLGTHAAQCLSLTAPTIR